MAKIWRNRIIAGDKTYEECPTRYKAQVITLLRADVANGVITEEQFEEITGEPYTGVKKSLILPD